MQNLYDPPDLCGIDTESSLRLSSISTFHSTNKEVEAMGKFKDLHRPNIREIDSYQKSRRIRRPDAQRGCANVSVVI